MHLLILTPIFPPEIGGPATYTHELTNRLTNHQLTIITFSNQKPSPAKAKVIFLPLFPNHPFGFFLRQLNLLRHIFQHGQSANLFYIQGPIVVGVAGSILAKLLGKPSIIKFVGDIVWESQRNLQKTTTTLEQFYQTKLPISSQILLYFQRLSFTLTDHIITPSSYLKDFLIHTHHINPAKISVIHNAIETKSHKKTKKKSHQLIFVGRLVSWKNVDQIIKAVNIARKDKPWKLVIVGEGPELAKLKKLSSKLKASNWLNFTGKLSKSKTHQLIAESQKLILYSDYEGQPHVLIEAMLLGTHIVASDITPNREVLGTFGQLVAPQSPNSLSLALNQPSKNIKTAQTHASKTYSWNSHIKQLNKTINQLQSS